MRRVYLSGPMSGKIDNNVPEFSRYARELRAIGFTVVNPAEIDPGCKEPTWADYMRADLREMLTCDAIVRMPGWESSRGARLELHVARRVGMEVVCADDLIKHGGKHA